MTDAISTPAPDWQFRWYLGAVGVLTSARRFALIKVVAARSDEQKSLRRVVFYPTIAFSQQPIAFCTG
jgi:hypothetical protein